MKVNTMNIAKEWIKNHITEGSVCVDATAGRGNDTVFLCELVGDKGKVYAFDIQEEAVESTKNLIKSKNLSAEIFHDSHINMNKYIGKETVDGIMFNFGYLPGGDHTKSTSAQTSIKAIEVGLELLRQGAVMCLCVYHGGDTGFEEKDAILKYIKQLDYKKYTVGVCELYNKPNNPPISVIIQKNNSSIQ